MKDSSLVLVLGGGEVGSLTASYLRRSGIAAGVVLNGMEHHLRRPLCFSECAFAGRRQLEGTTARWISPEQLTAAAGEDYAAKWRETVWFIINDQEIPVWSSDDFPDWLEVLQPDVIINTLESGPAGVGIDAAGLVVGLYPYHEPGQDCRIAVESRRNYWLGNICLEKPAPRPAFDMHFFKKEGQTVCAPLEGVFLSMKNIGDKVTVNEPLGSINGIEIRSPYHGQVWGMYHSGKIIPAKAPLALIYEIPAGEAWAAPHFEDRVVAGAVLGEVLRFLNTA